MMGLQSAILHVAHLRNFLCWDWGTNLQRNWFASDALPVWNMSQGSEREWFHCTIESLTVVSFAITAIRYQMLCMMIKQIALLIIMNHGMIMSLLMMSSYYENGHEDGIKYEDKFYLRWYAQVIQLERCINAKKINPSEWWLVVMVKCSIHPLKNSYSG